MSQITTNKETNFSLHNMDNYVKELDSSSLEIIDKLINENGPAVAGAVSKDDCNCENGVIVLFVTCVVLHKPFIDAELNGIIKILLALVTPFWITFEKIAPDPILLV